MARKPTTQCKNEQQHLIGISETDIKMPNNRKEKYHKINIVRGPKIKTTVRYHLKLVRMSNIKC
jgi:hypothetical protein